MPNREQQEIDFSRAVSVDSPGLVGYEPFTDPCDVSDDEDKAGLASAWRDGRASGRNIRLVVDRSGYFSIWQESNPFWMVMTDVQIATILRDQASRRLTCYQAKVARKVAENRHLDSNAQWRSSRERKAFERMREDPNLKPFFQTTLNKTD